MVSEPNETAPPPVGASVGGVVQRRAIDRDQQPSTALVMALCDAEGTTPDDMDPLQHHVTFDALDELFAPDRSQAREPDCSVAISLQQYWIFVDGETVVICRQGGDDSEEAIQWQ